ncbi:MerR family transcriptional regulator [Syntrophomonas curvata]
MERHLKIGEFAQLTGVTVKTVLHYHRMGLLAEVQRSSGGYRLYGAAELNRMRSIKHLKSMGLSLQQIKETLGEPDDCKSLRTVLLALQKELLTQISIMTERLERIQKLLDKEPAQTPSFQMITDILGEEALKQYLVICPEMYEQERKIHGIVDDLQWGVDLQDTFREVAEYFRDHPDKYQQSLHYGPRITAIADLAPDSPAIAELAGEYACFIKGLPFYEKLMSQSGLGKRLESLLTDMLAEVFSPSQMKMMELLSKYLKS